MADPRVGRHASARPAVNGPTGGSETSDDESFAELRSLLVGPEQRELMTLHEHLFDPAVQVRDVSRVLPDAIALRATDPQLTRALAPSIEDALTSIRVRLRMRCFLSLALPSGGRLRTPSPR
jgi:OOP family OmpA-OmpF porin